MGLCDRTLMTTTLHGHYIPGSGWTEEDKRGIRLAKNCGGVNICSDCQTESAEWQSRYLSEENAPVVAKDPVKNPAHYTNGKIEVWDFIVDQGLDFLEGNVVKYVCRAGKKDPAKTLEDLEKAKAYIDRKIRDVKEKAE